MPSTKSLRNTWLYLRDYDEPPNWCEVLVGEGNITWTEGQTVEYVTNRGRISSVDGGRATIGDDVPMEVTFDIIFEYYKDISFGSPEYEYKSPIEFMRSENAVPELCGPSAVDLVVYLKDPCDAANDEYLIFKRFMNTSLSYDLEAGTISASGQCLAIEPIHTTSAPLGFPEGGS